MLVLARDCGEKIVIRNSETGEIVVEIKVLSLDRLRCKLGFSATRKYRIVRSEIDNQKTTKKVSPTK